MPPGSSAIVAVFEETWIEEIDKALAKAEKVDKHKVDRKSVDEVDGRDYLSAARAAASPGTPWTAPPGKVAALPM